MISLTRRALARPFLLLAFMGLMTGGLGIGMFQLSVRTDGAALHPKGSPVVRRNTEDRAQFKEQDRLLLLLSAREGGPSLATQDGLLFLEEMHRKVARLPGVDGEKVRSLASLLAVPDEPNLRCLPTFLDYVPTSREAFESLLRRIDRFAPARGLFLSRDGSAAAIAIPLERDALRANVVHELEKWIGDRSQLPFRMRLTGPVVAETTLGAVVLMDLAWLVPLMVAALTLLLFLALRTAAGLAATLMEVLAVLIWIFGIMGFAGIPITLVTTILPVVLMTMAVTDEVHFLERFSAEFWKGNDGRSPEPSHHDRVGEAVLASLSSVGRPIVATSLTTAAGFLSFASATMAPIRQFGVLAAVGILLAMVFSFTFIPALLAVLPAGLFRRIDFGGAKVIRQPAGLGGFILRRPRHGLVLVAALVLIGIAGFLRLRVQDSWVANFSPSSNLVSAERDFNAAFWGSYRFDVVLTAGNRFFLTPQGIGLVHQLVQDLSSVPRVGGSLSHLVHFQRIAELQKKEKSIAAFSQAELDKVLQVAQFTWERMDLSHLVTREGDRVRIQLFIKSPDYRIGKSLAEAVRKRLEARLEAFPEVGYHFSGDLPLAVAVVAAIVKNQAASISLTLLGIGVLLGLYFGSFKMAMAAMLPVLVGAYYVLAAMGFFGIDFGIATSMFLTLSVGVGVDFSIHFIHAFRDYRQKGLEAQTSLRATISGTGRALRWNSLILVLGFLVLTLSALPPNRYLGLLLACAVAAAYLATLSLLPPILKKFNFSISRTLTSG